MIATNSFLSSLESPVQSTVPNSCRSRIAGVKGASKLPSMSSSMRFIFDVRWLNGLCRTFVVIRVSVVVWLWWFDDISRAIGEWEYLDIIFDYESKINAITST